MEFPPEIVDLIREYSRPCFKYFREYKRVMRLAGLVQWPLLKDNLLSQGDKIVSYVLAYERALIDWNKVSRDPYKLDQLTLDELYKTRRRARTKTLTVLVDEMRN
jgi:hypothetical protein